jgi:hypothetical protein
LAGWHPKIDEEEVTTGDGWWDDLKMERAERSSSMSIQSLKESLPELSDADFEKVYRQFFIRAHATLLGYEVSRCTGLAQGEGWEQILNCFDTERERRYGGRQA